MRPLLVALLAIALSSLPSAAAHAQGKPAAGKSDSNIAGAKKLFEDGAESYTQGNYEAAITAWEKSYELSKKPLIFENIANAYERLGNPRKAREYLQKWREVAPPEEQGILDARIKNLSARVAHDDEVEAARKAQEEKARREGQAQGQAKGLGVSAPVIGLWAGGGAAVVVGVALDVVAFSQRPASTDCVATSAGKICRDDARDKIKLSNSLAIAGDVLWIVGAAAAASGVGLFIMQKKGAGAPQKDAGPKTAIVPSVTPRSAGVLLQQTF